MILRIDSKLIDSRESIPIPIPVLPNANYVIGLEFNTTRNYMKLLSFESYYASHKPLSMVSRFPFSIQMGVQEYGENPTVKFGGLSVMFW